MPEEKGVKKEAKEAKVNSLSLKTNSKQSKKGESSEGSTKVSWFDFKKFF